MATYCVFLSSPDRWCLSLLLPAPQTGFFWGFPMATTNTSAFTPAAQAVQAPEPTTVQSDYRIMAQTPAAAWTQVGSLELTHRRWWNERVGLNVKCSPLPHITCPDPSTQTVPFRLSSLACVQEAAPAAPQEKTTEPSGLESFGQGFLDAGKAIAEGWDKTMGAFAGLWQ